KEMKRRGFAAPGWYQKGGAGEGAHPLAKRSAKRAALLARNSALRFATAPLAGLAHLALTLHGGLLVVTPPLDLLQDSFLGHLLLQNLQRLIDGIPDFNFERTAEQCLQAWAPFGK